MTAHRALVLNAGQLAELPSGDAYYVDLGSAAAPAVAIGAADTGVFGVSGAVGVSIGGSEIARVSAAGLAVGGTSVGARLHVYQAASGIGAIVRANATTPGDLLQLQASNASVLVRVTSDGKLGVGGNPIYNVHVTKAITGGPGNWGFVIAPTSLSSNDTVLRVNGPAVTGNTNLAQFASPATTGCSFDLTNTNNTDATADAKFNISSTSANGGDALFVFGITGVRNWALGIDNSDGDSFKLAASAGLGNNDALIVDTNRNFGFWGSSFADAQRALFIGNAGVVATTNPTGGGLLYAEGGALKWRGSSGTVTTLAAA